MCRAEAYICPASFDPRVASGTTVVEKIWGIVVEVAVAVSELTGTDAEILMTQIIETNRKLAEDNRKLVTVKAYAEAA